MIPLDPAEIKKGKTASLSQPAIVRTFEQVCCNDRNLASTYVPAAPVSWVHESLGTMYTSYAQGKDIYNFIQIMLFFISWGFRPFKASKVHSQTILQFSGILAVQQSVNKNRSPFTIIFYSASSPAGIKNNDLLIYFVRAAADLPSDPCSEYIFSCKTSRYYVPSTAHFTNFERAIRTLLSFMI